MLLHRLLHRLEQIETPAAVAFSGGVDSACLLHMMSMASAGRVVAILMDSIFLADSEKRWALRLASAMDVELHVVKWHPLDDSKIQKNSSSRCYYCKHKMYAELWKYAEYSGIRSVLDGTHDDDMHSERPGYRAVVEHGVCTPFAEEAIGKREIREMAEALPLHVGSRPSQSCLAARIVAGQKITGPVLKAIENVEEVFIRAGSRYTRCKVENGNAVIFTDMDNQGIIDESLCQIESMECRKIFGAIIAVPLC